MYGRAVKSTFAVLLALLLPAMAWAQEAVPDVPEIVTDENIAAGEEGQGWDGALSVTANFNLTSNKKVVGQVEGEAVVLGFGVLGALDYIAGPHVWRNTLSWTEAWTQPANIDRFVKSADVLDIESLYNYFFLEQVGAFARVKFNAVVFPTTDVQPGRVDYVAANAAMGAAPLKSDTFTFDLADAFQPITLEQTAGIFAEPYQSEPFRITTRVGFGGRETFAEGVFVVDTDASDENTIVLNELEDIFQAGAEFFAGIDGKLFRKTILYEAGAKVLLPFVNNDEQERDGFELRRIVGFATVTVGVVEWLSINYQLRIVDDPQLVEEVQIQNLLLVSLQYTLIERKNAEGSSMHP